MEAFAEHTKDARIMSRLQTKLHQNARYVNSLLQVLYDSRLLNSTCSRHAKVSPDATAAPTALLSLDDFEAASKDWEGREEQDDDE